MGQLVAVFTKLFLYCSVHLLVLKVNVHNLKVMFIFYYLFKCMPEVVYLVSKVKNGK